MTTAKEVSLRKDSKKKPQNTSYYIHSIIGVLIMFGFGYLEPFSTVTPLGMKILGVFLGLIYLWSFVGTLWPSMLGILALTLTGFGSMGEVLKLSFGDTSTNLCLFAMILFGAIQDGGVVAYMSRWFLTRKIINGRPVVFSFIFIYATYVISAAAHVLPALLLMWSILYSVLDDVGYKKGDKYTTIMVIGTMYGAISGQAAKPFFSSAAIIVGAYENVTGMSMEYLPYMIFGIIIATLGIIAYTLLIKFVFKPDMSKIASISTDKFENEEVEPMGLREKILFASLFAFLGFMLLPSVLPDSMAIVSLLNQLTPVGITIGFVAVLCFLRADGKPLMDLKKIMGQYVTWDVHFLVAMAMAISAALTAEGTGICDFFIEVLSPLLGGRSPIVFASIFIIISMIITNFANNAVMGVVLMPVMYAFALENGTNPAVMATVMTFALHISLMTPAASPFSAILHGNTEWIDKGDIMKYGGIIFIVTMIISLAVGMPIANFLFDVL